VKRRGFTLIELMVVIAIIIILAAIAIPNYLTMTARAKKSRVASDFAAIATALETYRTDWNIYPIDTGHILTSAALDTGYFELTGTAGAATNISGKSTAANDAGPIVYMTTNILDSMKNPYNSSLSYIYYSSTSGNHWRLYASELSSGISQGSPYWGRSDTSTNVSEETTEAAPGN